MNNSIKKWTLCPGCFQLLYVDSGVGKHVCPPEIRAKADAELDAVVDVELSTWEKDLKKFWKSKDVRFYEYLANRKKI